MREIKRIFVHCTATSPTATIDALWNGWKKLRWKKPGYHYVVKAVVKTYGITDVGKIEQIIKFIREEQQKQKGGAL